MPPKIATAQRGNRSVAVGSTHPANVAAAKKKAAATTIGGEAAVLTRTSPPRDAKSAASARITEQISPPVRVPVASVAPAMAETTPGVSISFVSDETERSPKRAKSGVSSVDGSQNLSPADCDPAFPPLWNAWYSACCRVVTYVGDGGVLKGKCGKCGNARPSRKHTMLDPDQIGKLEKTPTLSFDALMEVDASRVSFHSGLSTSNPRGNARMSPRRFEELEDASLQSASLDYDSEEDDDNIDNVRTDLEVSKYSFFERLHHYMERVPISEENRGTVELAVMVEAGSIVREMGTMTKERRESAYYEEYMNVLHDIPHELFAEGTVRENMMSRFKGMRKGDMNPGCLLRKYETEMTALKKFAYTFPGFGSLNKLPSGTPQLQHLRQPVVTKLWVANNPVSHVLQLLYWFSPPSHIVDSHVYTGD